MESRLTAPARLEHPVNGQAVVLPTTALSPPGADAGVRGAQSALVKYFHRGFSVGSLQGEGREHGRQRCVLHGCSKRNADRLPDEDKDPVASVGWWPLAETSVLPKAARAVRTFLVKEIVGQLAPYGAECLRFRSSSGGGRTRRQAGRAHGVADLAPARIQATKEQPCGHGVEA